MNQQTLKIHESVLTTIGHTPMIRLSRIGKGLPGQIYAKCEFFNPTAATKDRIALGMIEAAERAGRIKPGDTLIEPTSGNTGIGLAMVAALKGYRLIIALPEKMSMEKQTIMEALGAEIVRTPNVAHDHPESNFSVARRLAQELPNAHVLDQFNNPDNPQTHYETTAREILEQMDGDIDYFVASVGTGGTLAGIARCLKEELPDCRIIGVDPVGSLIGGGETFEPFLVEGIGYDFVPSILDQDLVDRYIKVSDEDTFRTAKRLMKEEGLLIGGSSGTATWAAMQIADICRPGARIVVMLPDSVRNYMSKFMDPNWLKENNLDLETDSRVPELAGAYC